MLAILMAADALVASNISLGLVYFFPLTLGALTFPRRELIALICACIGGRILFGPTGDPLGLATMAYRLPSGGEVAVNLVMTTLGYSTVGSLLLRVRRQRRRLHELAQEVETDPLTAVGNRRALSRNLAALLQKQHEASILCVDIDHFKVINDTWGHEMGDRVLQQLAMRLTAATRGPDLVARTGGEEFIVVLPRTDGDEAALVAERVRQAVCDEPMVVGDLQLPVTVSVGVSTGVPNEQLLAAADGALYQAKRAGRNRVARADAKAPETDAA